MKLLNLVPVIGDVWTDAIGHNVFKHLRPDTTVETWGIEHGSSSSEGEYDRMMGAPETVFLCQKAAREGFDGIFINCFCDLGVRAAREVVDLPVFGGFEPVMHLALGMADRIGIITVLPHAVSMIHANIGQARLDSRVVCVRNLDIPVLALKDHQNLVDAVVEQAIAAITLDHAQAIVMGCTGFINLAEDAQQKLREKGYDTVVLEAARSAVMLLESCVLMGLRQSRLTYLPPREKTRRWWGE